MRMTSTQACESACLPYTYAQVLTYDVNQLVQPRRRLSGMLALRPYLTQAGDVPDASRGHTYGRFSTSARIEESLLTD